MKGFFLIVIAAYVGFCSTLYIASFAYDVNQAPVTISSVHADAAAESNAADRESNAGATRQTNAKARKAAGKRKAQVQTASIIDVPRF